MNIQVQIVRTLLGFQFIYYMNLREKLNLKRFISTVIAAGFWLVLSFQGEQVKADIRPG
jgi:hypothetical protein